MVVVVEEIDLSDPSAWGRQMNDHQYERDLGNGNKVITDVFWIQVFKPDLMVGFFGIVYGGVKDSKFLESSTVTYLSNLAIMSLVTSAKEKTITSAS